MGIQPVPRRKRHPPFPVRLRRSRRPEVHRAPTPRAGSLRGETHRNHRRIPRLPPLPCCRRRLSSVRSSPPCGSPPGAGCFHSRRHPGAGLRRRAVPDRPERRPSPGWRGPRSSCPHPKWILRSAFCRERRPGPSPGCRHLPRGRKRHPGPSGPTLPRPARHPGIPLRRGSLPGRRGCLPWRGRPRCRGRRAHPDRLHRRRRTRRHQSPARHGHHPRTDRICRENCCWIDPWPSASSLTTRDSPLPGG